jgi:hypothetical protein
VAVIDVAGPVSILDVIASADASGAFFGRLIGYETDGYGPKKVLPETFATNPCLTLKGQPITYVAQAFTCGVERPGVGGRARSAFRKEIRKIVVHARCRFEFAVVGRKCHRWYETL